MKRLRLDNLILTLLTIAVLSLAACSDKKIYSAFTQDFISMVETDTAFKSMLVESIDLAKNINPDPITNPVQNLDQYYDFIEWSTMCMPWSIIKSPNGTTLFDQIDQSLIYFYYIPDMQLKRLEGKGYYNNTLQYHEPYRSWLVAYSKRWGEFLSTPQSWNKEYEKAAYDDPIFGLQNGWYEDPSDWKSFNDFFARYLKSPDMRPIAEPGNDAVIASPADSKPQGIWAVDSNSDIAQREGVLIKSKVFNSIPMLIGEGSSYQNAFADGTLTHTFLNVNDYHRYHFPMGGTIKEIRRIAADDAAGGVVAWDAASKKYILNCDTPGWQSIETRGCVILETEDYGLVALLPIGMSQVSSVNFENDLKVGDVVKKGDMLGYFLFGGSDFVIIFQKGLQFELSAPRDGDGYSHILMGEKYGTLSGSVSTGDVL